MQILERNLVKVKISDLIFDETNPNVMTDEQMEGLRESMRRFGYLTPIVIDQNSKICDGEHRAIVYREFGYIEIPAFRVEIADDSERRLLRQVMNKLHGIHDKQKDADELKILFENNKLQDLSMLIAKPEEEFQRLLTRYHDIQFAKNDDFNVDEELEKPAIVKRGDVWMLGKHFLMCGDCFTNDVNILFNGKKANLLLTDPPYGVSYEQGKYRITQPKMVKYKPILNDDKNEVEFFNMLKDLFIHLKEHVLENNAVFYVFSASLINSALTLQALTYASYHVQSAICWVKQSIVMGRSDYKWQHENIYYGFLGNPHYWCGDHTQGTIWNISRDASSKYEHPTQKPVELAHKAITNSSRENDTVFDAFAGSGFVLLACEQTNRICYAM